MSDELDDIVSEVEKPFLASGNAAGNSFRDRLQNMADIVFTRVDYATMLNPLLQNPVSVDADLLRVYANQAKSALRDDLGLHLEPVGDQARKETAADKVEAMEVHDLMRLDPNGYIRDDIHDMQARSLAYTGWLEQLDYVETVPALGETTADHNKREERNRASWFPFSLSSKAPDTVAWMESERLPTIAVCRYDLPFVDLMERYGADYGVKRDDPEKMLKVYNEHFKWIRAGTGQAELNNARDFYTNVAHCMCVDDGVTLRYSVDFSTKRGNESRYKEIDGSKRDNPFGAVSLLLAEGVYNAFEPLAYKREPLIMSMIKIEYGRAILKTGWASDANSPRPIFHELPPEVALKGEITPGGSMVSAPLAVSTDGRPMLTDVIGKVYELERQGDIAADKLFGILDREEQIAAPRGILFDPETNKGTVAVSVTLKDLDERDRLLSSAKKSECNLFSHALDMMRTARRTSLNKHRKTGDAKAGADWSYSFTTTGKEWPTPGRVIKRGETFEVTPQDLDGDYVRTIEPVDNRLSTQSARADYADARRATNSILYDDWLTMKGVENVTEFKEKFTAEQLYQLDAPRIVMDMRMRVAQFTAFVNGQSVEEVLATIPESVNSSLVMAGGGAPPAQGNGTIQMASPVTEGITNAGSSSPV